MLKIKSQLLVAAAAVVAGSFGFAGSAFAGEGGIAGSASFFLDGAGNVTEASTAVAVGKSAAYAGAVTNTDVGTEAFAGGTGGSITLTGNSVYIQSISRDITLAAEQVNQLDANDVQIDVELGTVKVNTPAGSESTVE